MIDPGGKRQSVPDPGQPARSPARLVQSWLAERRATIEVFHLPPYNPDEGLNADLKQAVTRKPSARSKHDLKRNLISHMRSLSKRPGRIRSYFGHHTFRYAA